MLRTSNIVCRVSLSSPVRPVQMTRRCFDAKVRWGFTSSTVGKCLRNRRILLLNRFLTGVYREKLYDVSFISLAACVSQASERGPRIRNKTEMQRNADIAVFYTFPRLPLSCLPAIAVLMLNFDYGTVRKFVWFDTSGSLWNLITVIIRAFYLKN